MAALPEKFKDPLNSLFLQQKKSTKIAIAVALAGIIILLLLSSAFPFKDKLFSTLYPKPTSFAQGGWKSYDEQVKAGKIKPAQQVLIVNLSYNTQNTPQLTIKNMQKKNGYPSTRINDGKKYLLEVVDDQNNPLYTFNFNIPDTVTTEWFDEETPPTTPKGAISKVPTADFTIVLPVFSTASKVRIIDPDKKMLDAKDIQGIPVVNNQPNFYSVTGDESSQTPRKKTFWEKMFLKESYAATTDYQYVDIVFIGDNYTYDQLSIFHQDRDFLKDELLKVEPFLSERSKMNFTTIDNTGDLGCLFVQGNLCNRDIITKKLTDAGVTWDMIYVIVYDARTQLSTGDILGNGGFGYDLAFGSTYSTYKFTTFAHELGHTTIGNSLIDEYTAYTINGVIDNTTHNNCYAGTPPAKDWTDKGVNEYYLGCTFPNWFRSSSGSIMGDGLTAKTNPYYNYISQLSVRSGIEKFTSAPPSSPTPPPPSSTRCSYAQSCTGSDGSSGLQLCYGALDNNVCKYNPDVPHECRPETQNCTTACNCVYAMPCQTTDGKDGFQACLGKLSNGVCKYDETGICTGSLGGTPEENAERLCMECAVTTANLPVPNPTPTPPPTPAPNPPAITKNISCVNSPYSGSEVTISWTNPSGYPVSWVDISPNFYFDPLWNKTVSSLSSTAAPVGFSNSLLQPDTSYYVRLYNGTHSQASAFSIPSCPPVPPSIVSFNNYGVTSSAASTPRYFTGTYGDGNGYKNIKNAYFLVSVDGSGANAMYAYYDQGNNKLYLRDAANTTWLGGYIPTSGNTITNNYFTLNVNNTNINGSSGNNLVLNWNITPLSPTAGKTYKMFLRVQDLSGQDSGWKQVSTLSVTQPPVTYTPIPSIVSFNNYGVTSSGINIAKYFTGTYGDGNGYTDIKNAFILASVDGGGTNALYAYYDQINNKLYLRNAANTAWLGGYTPTSGYTITNSYFTLNVYNTNKTNSSGNNLVLNWNLTPLSPTQGKTYRIWLRAQDKSNLDSYWKEVGKWSIY